MKMMGIGYVAFGLLAWVYMLVTRREALTPFGWDDLLLIPELMILALVA